MKKFLIVFTLFSILALSYVPASIAQGYTVTELWHNPMAVNDVAVSGDGNYVVAVNDTGVYFFSRDSSQPRWWYTLPGGYFVSVAISANGDYVVAGFTNTSGNGFLYYFKDSTITFGARGYTWIGEAFPGEIDSSRLVAMSDDGNFVVGGANNYTDKNAYFLYFNDSTVRSGSPENNTWNAQVVNLIASSLDMSADGNYVAIGGSDPPPGGGVVLMTSTPLHAWYNLSLLSPIIDVATSDDGYALAAVSPVNYTLYYWKDPDNLPVDSPANWTNLRAYGCVDMSSDGDIVVAGTQWPLVCGVHLWDGARIRTGMNETESWNMFAGQFIPDIAISRDGLIIAATAVNMTEESNWVYFFTLSGNLIGQFEIDDIGTAVSTSISGNTTAIAATSGFRTVYVYGITELPGPVGGEILGLNGFGFIAPYLMVVLLVAGTTIILLKRRRL